VKERDVIFDIRVRSTSFEMFWSEDRGWDETDAVLV